MIGLIAMLGVHELLKMKGLETATFEGALAMLAAFVLTLPIEDYLPLPSSRWQYDCLRFNRLDSNGNNCSRSRITIMRMWSIPLLPAFMLDLVSIP